MLAVALVLQTATLHVGGHGGYPSLGAALADAASGDTLVVHAGTYRERVVIDSPVVIIGEPGAVIDGEGEGTVIRVIAPAVIRGLTISGSGPLQDEEDSGIMVENATGVVLEDNSLSEVLFGIYLKQTDSARIRNNRILGKSGVPTPRRGDGIRLWYSSDGRIEGNVLVDVRDLVIWFSDHNLVVGNTVTDSRYGLHFMYSTGNRFVDNVFERNEVGTFVMYSDSLEFEGNVFADARGGTGRGLGFKDSDAVIARHNIIVNNAAGIVLDNSPHSRGVFNVFEENTLAYNDVAVTHLPSVTNNRFVSNDLIGNVSNIRISGGGRGEGNYWNANFFSDYVGFDSDGNGVGDTPYVFERVAENVLAEHDELQVFALSPALEVISLLGRVLPLLKPEPLLVDSAPRVATSPVLGAGASNDVDSNTTTVLVLTGVLVAAAVALGRRLT